MGCWDRLGDALVWEMPHEYWRGSSGNTYVVVNQRTERVRVVTATVWGTLALTYFGTHSAVD